MEQKTKEQILKEEIKELLSQVALKLKDISTPNIEYDDGGYSRLNNFEDKYELDENGKPKDLTLASIKIITEAILKDLSGKRKWSTEAEKMARAYYTSFCNA